MDLPEPVIEPLTLQECYLQCSIDPDEDEDGTTSFVADVLLEIYVSAARAWCELYTGAAIGQRAAITSSITTFPANGGAIELAHWPVLGVQSISYVNTDGDEIVIGEDVWDLVIGKVAPARVVLRPNQTWPDDALDNETVPIIVTYAVGYSAPGESPQDRPMPKALKSAMLLIVAHLWKNREATAAVNLQNIPMGVKPLLNPFRVRKGFA